MNRVMEIEIENPFEEFEETPRMSMPRFPGNFLGHRDRDEDFDFGGLFDHLTNQVMSSQVIPTSSSHHSSSPIVPPATSSKDAWHANLSPFPVVVHKKDLSDRNIC